MESFDTNINIKLLNVNFYISDILESPFDFSYYIRFYNDKGNIIKEKNVDFNSSFELEKYFLEIFKKRPRPVEFVRKVGGIKNYNKALKNLSIRIVSKIMSEENLFYNTDEEEKRKRNLSPNKYICCSCGSELENPPFIEGIDGPRCRECSEIFESKDESFIDYEYELSMEEESPFEDIENGVYKD